MKTKVVLIAVVAVLALGAFGAGLWLATPIIKTLGLGFMSDSPLADLATANSAFDPSAAIADSLLSDSTSDPSQSTAPSASPSPTPGPGVAAFVSARVMHVIRLISQREMPAIAKALNLTSDQLKSDLQSGQTLSQIAQQQAISQDTLSQVIVDTAKDVTASLVNQGKITQYQGTQIVNHLNIQRIVNRSFGHH